MLKARPSRLLGGSGGWLVSKEGGGWNFFSTFGWSTRSPFSRQGLAFVFHSVVFVCVLCLDSLSVLLARVVWLFLCFSFCRWCSYARPWFLIRELVVCCWLSCPPVVLRLACAPSCFVGPFCICGVATCFFLALFLLACVCSVELLFAVVGVRGGFLFLLRNCLCRKRVSYHRRLPPAPRSANACLWCPVGLSCLCPCSFCCLRLRFVLVLAYLCTACNARARSCGPFVPYPL